MLQLFFDGKQREDAATGARKEGIAVAVSGPGMEKEKFLGNKSVDQGTGAAAADAVRRVVFEWGLSQKIIALTYDTCSVNTGPGNG